MLLRMHAALVENSSCAALHAHGGPWCSHVSSMARWMPHMAYHGGRSDTAARADVPMSGPRIGRLYLQLRGDAPSASLSTPQSHVETDIKHGGCGRSHAVQRTAVLTVGHEPGRARRPYADHRAAAATLQASSVTEMTGPNEMTVVS